MPHTANRVSLFRMTLQAGLILAVSMSATVAAWRWTEQQGEALEVARFGETAVEAADELLDRMDGYHQLLLSGVALLEASDRVEREEWRRFVERLEISHLYPGTQGVGYAERLRPGQWARHEAEIRAQGFPDYHVIPTGPRDEAYPIVYLEPFAERNIRAFGYDMFSEPVRHDAMARARDSGEPALSGKVTLVQETGQDVQVGVLLYVPFYDGDPKTVEQRRASIRGFVYSPLRMGDLVRGGLAERLEHLCVEVYDQVPTPANLMFANTGCRPGRHMLARPLDLYSRHWVVLVHSTPALDEEVANRHSRLILGAGAIISLLLVWVLVVMLAERQRRVALDRAQAALEMARAEAAGALAAKGRFMAAASHDLRQPLQSLGLLLQVLVDQRGKGGSVERAALQAFEATKRLVDGMFDAAALESGRAQPVKERIDVGDLVERIGAESRAEAASRGLRLRMRLCHVEVETDKLMLERILRNLMSNALKYTVSGGILVACRASPDTVRIKVADSGPGIPEDKRELIFEDFFQLENPERDPRKGLGLGLARVARTARALGFRLHVLSRPGLGSTFVVEIPRVRKPGLDSAA